MCCGLEQSNLWQATRWQSDTQLRDQRSILSSLHCEDAVFRGSEQTLVVEMQVHWIWRTNFDHVLVKYHVHSTQRILWVN